MQKLVNIGCGPLPLHPQHIEYMTSLAPIEEWDLVDKFVVDDGILNYDGTDLPYPDGFLDAIYSSHSLEHFPHIQTEAILRHWYSKLQPGGKLTINVPDLHWVCREVFRYEAEIPLERYYTRWEGEHGLLSIFYGSQSHEGEYHQAGFTRRSIKELLARVGFTEIEISQFVDGHEMGVLFVEAIKPDGKEA